jgi:putative nucleotidyltransferase with HDIG domain
MNEQELHNLKRWFSEYCRSFYTADQIDQKNILLKEEHTHNVCANMTEIARSLGLEKDRAARAEAVALFHDIGRFPQYRQYRTFRDSISTNHAALGAAVLIEHEVLKNVPDTERNLIVRAVTLHNVFEVPGKLDDETLLFVKMIRDADKLDIWRVFIDLYAQPDEDRPNAAGLGLPDTAEYSPDVLASLRRKEMVHLSTLRTVNDFKLLQLAWIFDLNFERSLQLVLERSIIDRTAATLPRTPEIAQAVASMREYVDKKLNGR